MSAKAWRWTQPPAEPTPEPTTYPLDAPPTYLPLEPVKSKKRGWQQGDPIIVPDQGPPISPYPKRFEDE